MKLILYIALLFQAQLLFGQQRMERAQQERFWQECVLPIVNKDSLAIEKLVYDTLQGDWGQMANLNKPKSEWTREDFSAHMFEVLDPTFRRYLRKMSPTRVKAHMTKDGKPELLVGTYFQERVERNTYNGGKTLRYRKIDGKYRLYSIHRSITGSKELR